MCFESGCMGLNARNDVDFLSQINLRISNMLVTCGTSK